MEDNTIEEKKMCDAMAVANYFIKRANEEGVDLTILKLLKLCFLAHGYCLAIVRRSFLNRRYDTVEAWKYGPVIPSIYHSFKHWGAKSIKERGVVITSATENDEPTVVCPVLDETDTDLKVVIDYIWQRFSWWDAFDLVDLLHAKNSPWAVYYRVGENKEIPDEYIQQYYIRFISLLLAKRRREKMEAKKNE